MPHLRAAFPDSTRSPTAPDAPEVPAVTAAADDEQAEAEDSEGPEEPEDAEDSQEPPRTDVVATVDGLELHQPSDALVIADSALRLPFRSQVDRETEPDSWPHVHLEVQDVE